MKYSYLKLIVFDPPKNNTNTPLFIISQWSYYFLCFEIWLKCTTELIDTFMVN